MATRKNPDGSHNVKAMPDIDNDTMIGIEAYTQGVEINDVNADRTGGMPILGRSVSGHHKLVTVTKSGNEIRLVEERGHYNNAFTEDIRCDFRSRSIFNVESVTFTLDASTYAPASGSFTEVSPVTSSIENSAISTATPAIGQIFFSGSYGNRPGYDVIVSLTSTDGTIVNYTSSLGSTSTSTNVFDVDSDLLPDSVAAGTGFQEYAAEQLMDCINASSGHGGKILATLDSSGTTVQLSQVSTGYSGNTVITVSGDTSGSIIPTDFHSGLDNTIFVATSSYATNEFGDYPGRAVIGHPDGTLANYPKRQVTKWYLDWAVSGNANVSGSNSDLRQIHNNDSDATDGRDFQVDYKPKIKSVTFGDRGIHLPRSAEHSVFVKQVPNPETFVPITGYQSEHDDSEIYVDRASLMTSSKVDIIEYMKRGHGEIMNHPSYKHSYASSGIIEIAHRRTQLYGNWTYLFSQRWPQASWIGYAQNEQQVDVYENSYDVRERNYNANPFEDRGTPYTHDSRQGIIGDIPLVNWDGFLMPADLHGDTTVGFANATIDFQGGYLERPGLSMGVIAITSADGTKIIYTGSNVSRYELQTATNNVTNDGSNTIVAAEHGLHDGCRIYITSSEPGEENTDAPDPDIFPAGYYFVRNKTTNAFQIQAEISSSATVVEWGTPLAENTLFWSAPVFDVVNTSAAALSHGGGFGLPSTEASAGRQYQIRAAVHLSGALLGYSGHAGKISVSLNGTRTGLILSQSVYGPDGNTIISLDGFDADDVALMGFVSGSNPFTLSKAEKFLDEEYYVPEDNLTIEPFVDRKFQDLLFIEPEIADILAYPPDMPYDPMKRNITGSLNNDDDWVLGVVDMRTGFDDYAGQKKDSMIYRDLKR